MSEIRDTIWNKTELMERVGRDEELLQDIINIFLDDLPDKLEQIKNSYQSSDAPALSQAAHSLKGAAGSVSAGLIYDLSCILEKMGRRGQVDQASQTISDLEREIKVLVSTLIEEGFTGQ